MNGLSNQGMALMLLREENKNLENALKVLQYDDSDRRARIRQLLIENDVLKLELKKERETNEGLKKYMKRQDRFIAYLKEHRDSWQEDKGGRSTTGSGRHLTLCRKRSNSMPK
jgi:DNA-directed RNA polymerase specialized sigma54-like protein